MGFEIPIRSGVSVAKFEKPKNIKPRTFFPEAWVWSDIKTEWVTLDENYSLIVVVYIKVELLLTYCFFLLTIEEN